jgi:23S rRNA (uridine2552-2'-O)-methyltransferase
LTAEGVATDGRAPIGASAGVGCASAWRACFNRAMPQPRKLHDAYFKKAKAEGYLARSAYKLKEIQERKQIIRVGDAVLDLGCAPGSWMQVASELVGPAGRVVGIDLQDVAAGMPPNVSSMVGDIFKASSQDFLGAAGFAPGDLSVGFDVVLSDMAPNTTGHGDDLLSARLCRRVLELLPPLLRPGGYLAMKIFEGGDYPAVLNETKALFREARGFKPQASRDVSRELYIVGHSYRPPTAAMGKDRAVGGVDGGRGSPPKPKAGWNA